MTKFEELCRIICLQQNDDPDRVHGTGVAFWMLYKRDVSEVLNALLKPTPGMIKAADEVAGTINPIDAFDLVIRHLLEEEKAA